MENRTKRVLITGGAGFIGGHLVRILLARGCDVVVIDDLSTGHAGNLPLNPRLRLKIADVRDVRVYPQREELDLVIHAAGIVGMRLAGACQEKAYEVAVESTQSLLKNIAAPIVLFSSSAVYGHDSLRPASEDSRIDNARLQSIDGGIAGYALGKWHMELLGQVAARRGRSVLIIRPFNIIGTRQQGRYGMVVLMPPLATTVLTVPEGLILHDQPLADEQQFAFSHT